MKYIDPITGERKSISVKASDTLPIGSIVEFNGNIIPEGWEEYFDDMPKYTDVDLDTVVGGIIVGYCHRCTNRPETGENGNIIFLPHRDYPTTYGVQIYISRPSGFVHIRNLENGVWSKWRSVTNDYSNNEQIIGKWIDGKPIYRKCFTLTSFTTIDYGDISIDNIINMTCTARSTESGGQWRTIPWIYNGFTAQWAGGFYMRTDNHKVYFQIGDDLSNNVNKVIFTMEYTKTTD